jgi:amino acid transporter
MLTPRPPSPLDTAIGSSAPYLLLFQNTGSNSVAFVLLIILFVLIFLWNVTALATTSREVWAFSRDKGILQVDLKSKFSNVPRDYYAP